MKYSVHYKGKHYTYKKFSEQYQPSYRCINHNKKRFLYSLLVGGSEVRITKTAFDSFCNLPILDNAHYGIYLSFCELLKGIGVQFAEKNINRIDGKDQFYYTIDCKNFRYTYHSKNGRVIEYGKNGHQRDVKCLMSMYS